MSYKVFTSPGGKLSSPEYEADFASARRFDKVLVGKLGVYYRDGLKTRVFPYPQLDRAFIRVQQVRGRMCCGQAMFDYFRLVLVSGGKEYSHILSEDEKLMDETLAAIHQAAPGVPVGV